MIPSALDAEDDIEDVGGVKHRRERYIVGLFENSTSDAEDDIENASLVGQSGRKIWGKGWSTWGIYLVTGVL